MSIEEKQQYLRAEIMDMGHDPSKFYEYWQSLQLDIERIQIEQLAKIVLDFKEYHKIMGQENQFEEYQSPSEPINIDWSFLGIKQQSNLKKQYIQENIPQIKSCKQTKSSIQQIDILDMNQTDKQMHQNDYVSHNGQLPDHSVSIKQVLQSSKNQIYKCLKLQQNILDHHNNIEISISKKENKDAQQQSGIFSQIWKKVGSNESSFMVKTLGRNKQKAIGISWQVERKAVDFQWLREMLVKFYPGIVVPPLPHSVRSAQKLVGYIRKLQAFLVDVFRCRQLRNSKYFQNFLSYSNRNDLETFKKSSQTVSEPGTLNHVLNMKGQITLYFGQKIDFYSFNLQNYLNSQSSHLKAVKQLTNEIMDQYDNLSIKFHQLSQIFNTMSQETQIFSVGRGDSEQQKCYPRLTQTYKQISSLIDQHSQFSLLERQFIQNYMLGHFSYEKDRVDNIQNLLKKRDQFAKEFSRKEANNNEHSSSMFSKLTNLFGNKQQSLNVPSPSLDILKMQVGFYNSQVLKQTTRCIDVMIESYVTHFSNYGDNRVDNVDNMQKVWSKVMVSLSKLSIK